jgi:hypothetical protein
LILAAKPKKQIGDGPVMFAGRYCYPCNAERGDIGSFYLVSSHGAVLFCVAANPDCTTNDIAEAMALTHRTVWGLLGDLRQARMLDVRKRVRQTSAYFSACLTPIPNCRAIPTIMPSP